MAVRYYTADDSPFFKEEEIINSWEVKTSKEFSVNILNGGWDLSKREMDDEDHLYLTPCPRVGTFYFTVGDVMWAKEEEEAHFKAYQIDLVKQTIRVGERSRQIEKEVIVFTRTFVVPKVWSKTALWNEFISDIRYTGRDRFIDGKTYSYCIPNVIGTLEDANRSTKMKFYPLGVGMVQGLWDCVIQATNLMGIIHPLREKWLRKKEERANGTGLNEYIVWNVDILSRLEPINFRVEDVNKSIYYSVDGFKETTDKVGRFTLARITKITEISCCNETLTDEESVDVVVPTIMISPEIYLFRNSLEEKRNPEDIVGKIRRHYGEIEAYLDHGEISKSNFESSTNPLKTWRIWSEESDILNTKFFDERDNRFGRRDFNIRLLKPGTFNPKEGLRFLGYDSTALNNSEHRFVFDYVKDGLEEIS